MVESYTNTALGLERCYYQFFIFLIKEECEPFPKLSGLPNMNRLEVSDNPIEMSNNQINLKAKRYPKYGGHKKAESRYMSLKKVFEIRRGPAVNMSNQLNQSTWRLDNLITGAARSIGKNVCNIEGKRREE